MHRCIILVLTMLLTILNEYSSGNGANDGVLISLVTADVLMISLEETDVLLISLVWSTGVLSVALMDVCDVKLSVWIWLLSSTSGDWWGGFFKELVPRSFNRGILCSSLLSRLRYFNLYNIYIYIYIYIHCVIKQVILVLYYQECTKWRVGLSKSLCLFFAINMLLILYICYTTKICIGHFLKIHLLGLHTITYFLKPASTANVLACDSLLSSNHNFSSLGKFILNSGLL